MPWDERLKEAAYTSPGGERFTFDYENVGRETDKKTTVFTFPDQDGAFIQDLGRGGRRFALRVFIWGSDYDQEVDRFFKALEEKGVGKLEHPRYGTFSVIPTGTIRQRDDLKTAANQAIIDVIFWETITEITFPAADTNVETFIDNSLDAFQNNVSAQVAETVDIDTSSETVDFKSKFLAGIAAVKTVLNDIAEAEQAIKSEFDAIVRNINDNIDDLIGTPAVLVFQAVELCRLPARAAASFQAKIDAYINLIDLSLGNTFEPSFDSKPENQFLIADFLAKSELVSLCEATLVTEFDTKPDAISAAEVIAENFDKINTWSDLQRDNLSFIDTGEAYQEYLNVIAADTARLVEISFSLKQERIIYLDRPRSIHDLTAELYGEVDNKIDFLITSNKLGGDEILEIPRGREIRYYI